MYKSPIKAETLRKLWALVPPNMRFKTIWQVLLMIVGSVLEMIGIALIMPIVTVITDSTNGTNNSILKPVYVRLGILKSTDIVVFVLLLLAFVFAVKSVFSVYLNWAQIDFGRRIEQDISSKLFQSFMNRPYLFHLQRNSADLIYSINSEVGQFSGAIVLILSVLSETLVVAALGVLVLYTNLWASISTLLMLLVAAIIYNRVVRRQLNSLAVTLKKESPKKIQYVSQGFGGIKDVTVLGLSESFTTQFDKQNFLLGKTASRYGLLTKVPAIWIEFVAVLGLVVTILVMLTQETDPTRIAPVLGLLTAVSFRFVPSTNRLIVATNRLRVVRPAIDSIYNEVQSSSDRVKLVHLGAFKSQIEMRNLSFSYPNTIAPSLQNTNVVVRKGETVGFIGPSGAGKSTLVDVILGLLPPTSGELLIDGIDMYKNNLEWQSTIGYVAQSIYLIDDTIRRNVAFGIAEHEIDDVALERALRSAQLWDFVDGLPEKTQTIVGERGVRVSGGQRQRIGIARALYHEPQVLVLDEATSSLDIDTETEVMSAIRALQGFKTILIVAHRLSTVQHCNRIYKIEDATIVGEGTLEELT